MLRHLLVAVHLRFELGAATSRDGCAFSAVSSAGSKNDEERLIPPISDAHASCARRGRIQRVTRCRTGLPHVRCRLVLTDAGCSARRLKTYVSGGFCVFPRHPEQLNFHTFRSGGVNLGLRCTGNVDMFVCRGGQEQTVAHGAGYAGVPLNAEVQPSYGEMQEENRRLKDVLLHVREERTQQLEKQVQQLEEQVQKQVQQLEKQVQLILQCQRQVQRQVQKQMQMTPQHAPHSKSTRRGNGRFNPNSHRPRYW